MENIRTRNDAAPAPKLPLTWDEATSDDEPQASAPRPASSPAPKTTPADSLSASSAQPSPGSMDSPAAEPDSASVSAPALFPDDSSEIEPLPLASSDAEDSQDESSPDAEDSQDESSFDEPEPEPAPTESSEPQKTSATSPAEAHPARSRMEQEIITLKTPDEPTSVILKRARSEKGVTIRDVCRKTFITQTFIEDLENGNFAGLPSKKQCCVHIERLCSEYDIPAPDIVDKFILEYDSFYKEKKEKEDNEQGDLPGSKKLHGLDMGHSSRPVNLPSILIILFVLLLVALFGYAFYAYRAGRLPDQLEIDLTEHVPIHKPKPVYLDEVRTRR